MKKKFYYLVLVLSLIFVFMAITACNGDNPAIVQPPTVTYDGVTQTLNWVAEKPLTDITILISGKTYNVTGSPYSIKQLQLEDGEYQLQFKCVYNGAPFSTFFIINIGEPIKDGKRIEFVDEYGKLIKAIYKSIDYVLTAEDYPTLATKNGVNYSWSVVAGEVINKNITISVVASYTEYTITYNLNGGNINGKTTYTEKYTIQSKNISIISPLKDNYLFGGYYDNENFSGMLISQIDYDNPKDYILFAKWKEISPDEKILLDCFKNTSALKYFTYVQVAPDGISEIAIDKDGYYYHYKKNNETKEVLTGGTLYNYTNKIRVPVSNEYADSVVAEFCLPDFSTDVISATIKESSASIVKYEVVTINGVMSVEVTGNIVTKIEMTQEGQTASISILTTPFERIAPKVEDFKEQININVFVIGGINDGREYLYKATIGGVINNAIDMKNCTFESEMKQYQTTNREWAFVGYFTDKECSKPFLLDTVLTNSINVYVKIMNTLEYYKDTEVTIKLHCGCSECNGVVKNIKFVYSAVMPDELLRHLGGKLIENGKFSERANIVINGENHHIDAEKLKYHIFENYFALGIREVVVDIHRTFTDAITHLVTFHCDCGKHANVFTRYYVINDIINVFEGHNTNGKYPYLFRDKEFTISYPNSYILEDMDIYVKWVDDTRNIVTYNYLDETINVEVTNPYGENSDIIKGIRKIKVWEDSNDRTILKRVINEVKPDKIIEGWYYDRSFTNQVGKDDIITHNVEVFAKWAETKQVQFIIDKSFENNNSKELFYSIALGKSIIWNMDWNAQLRYIYAFFGNGEMSSDKFYKDVARTQLIDTYDGTYSKIYVGKQKCPTLTIVCDCGRQGVSHKVALLNGQATCQILDEHFKGENIGVVERPTWYWSELTSYENMIDYDGFNQLLFFQDFTIYARYGAPQISNVVIKEGSVKQTYEVFEKISNSQVVAIIVVSYTLGKPSQEVEIRLNDISNFYFNIEGTREAKIDYFSHNLTFTYTVVDSRPKIVEANEFDISKNGEMFQLVLRNELVNSVMEYDFNGKITVESGATWKLYNNNNENKVEIVDKIAHFGVYDNAVTVYVEVTKGNKSMWYVAYLQKAGKTYLSFDSQTETSFEPVEVINGKPYTLPTNKPTKKGYIFDGWFVSGIRLDGLNWPYNTSAVAYAVWQIDSYTLTFDSAGGNSVPSIVVSYGGYYNLPIPTRVGHNFEGWFIDEICLDGQNWGFGENRTAVARWTANSYTLTFDSAGGDRVPSIVVSYGGNYTLPTTIKAGHTFEGWFIDETRIDGLNWSYGTNRDAVARWSRNSYTLTFDSAGGNSVPSIVVSYGGNYTLPTPTRAGYTFAGWFIDGTRVNGYNWFFEANKTAVARWTTNSYNLDFDSAGGNREPSISVSYGGNYDLPTPTRVGHTFVGWFIDETRIDGLNWLFETNKTAVARWTTNSYNLTVDSAGGNSIPSLVVSYGDYYNLPDPTRVGYTFEGWYKTNTNERFLGYCQWYIESDVSVTAKWTIATSRLSFNSDKGTTASPIIITYGQNYILPTSTKEGYIFDGWYVDATKLDGLNWTYDCDITAIAKWVAIDYTITYNVDGGLFDNLPLSTYRVNTADIILPKLTKLNYTFIGWYETDTFVGEKITSIKTGSLGNKVFYAKWEYGTEGLAYELVENTYIVASYSGTAITVEIPSTHNGMQVTKIKDNAFSRNAEVISIKLPDTIISIGTYAFSNCPLLNSINIPVSVKNIDAYAYSNCASLTGIIIPKNVSTIKQGVFENCIALTIYTEVYNKYDGWDANWNSSCPYVFACLDNELANDGWTYRIIDSVRYAFKGSNAKVVRQSSSISNDITILSQIRGKGNDICTVTSIDEQAFKGCSRIRSIIIPNSVTDIGANAFYGCASLATATINNGSPLSIIRSDLFQNCYALESIFIPKGVTDISEFAFFGCKSLKSIVFEAGSQLVVVQRYAFSQCENLANFVLPTSVEYIEEQAFSGCKSITEIFIPISTLHIGNSAFARCINLLKIDVDINNLNYTCGGANDVLYSRDLTKILQYALGRKNEMYTVNTWVRSVCEGAFESSQFLKRVIITENVTSIGARAFKHCEKLERVNFDQGCKALTDIGQNAFEFCIALKDITLPSNLKSISDGLLFNCELLKTVVIPTSVTSIGYYSFEDCRMLGNIELSKNIVSIGGYAFSKCYSLTKINIPLNVITIGAYTFADCNSLVVYADALSKPSTWDINWKGSNTAVCWDAKNNDVATNGKIYLLVDGLMYYINGEFAVVASKQAVSVEVVNILSAVTYKGKSYPITKIDDYAFYCCKLIKNCIIPRNITEIGYGAFNGCAADICIVVPKEVTKCEYAFPGSNNATVFYEGTLNSFGCNMINNCVLDETKSYVVSFTKKQSGIYISQITPIREGYVFAGWFDNAEFTGESIADLIKVVVGVDVYAKWQKKA